MNRLLALLVAFGLQGCSESPPEEASKGTGGQTLTAEQHWSEYAKADWSAVDGISDMGEIVEAMSHLSRFVDRCHNGSLLQVELFCDQYGRVFDRAGNEFKLDLTQWKGVHDLVQRIPEGRAAGRAMPAGAFDHADGHGEVARHAYFITRGSLHTLVFEVVKPADGPSGG